MASTLLAAFGMYFFGWLGFLVAFFLILLVLIQRGRGGGLAGAFGGMGGQSAFGAKAGDTFTRITVVVASIWILTCIATIKLENNSVNVQPAEKEPSIGTGSDGAPKEDAPKDDAKDDAVKDKDATKDADGPDGTTPPPVGPKQDESPVGPKPD